MKFYLLRGKNNVPCISPLKKMEIFIVDSAKQLWQRTLAKKVFD